MNKTEKNISNEIMKEYSRLLNDLEYEKNSLIILKTKNSSKKYQ